MKQEERKIIERGSRKKEKRETFTALSAVHVCLLETKAPIANQQEQQLTVHKEVEECADKDQKAEKISQVPEPMEIDAKQEKHNNEPIPLPPAPSSPTKVRNHEY